MNNTYLKIKPTEVHKPACKRQNEKCEMMKTKLCIQRLLSKNKNKTKQIKQINIR